MTKNINVAKYTAAQVADICASYKTPEAAAEAHAFGFAGVLCLLDEAEQSLTLLYFGEAPTQEAKPVPVLGRYMKPWRNGHTINVYAC